VVRKRGVGYQQNPRGRWRDYKGTSEPKQVDKRQKPWTVNIPTDTNAQRRCRKRILRAGLVSREPTEMKQGKRKKSMNGILTGGPNAKSP